MLDFFLSWCLFDCALLQMLQIHAEHTDIYTITECDYEEKTREKLHLIKRYTVLFSCQLFKLYKFEITVIHSEWRITLIDKLSVDRFIGTLRSNDRIIELLFSMNSKYEINRKWKIMNIFKRFTLKPNEIFTRQVHSIQSKSDPYEMQKQVGSQISCLNPIKS